MNGLVMAGGHSTRMGQDKSELHYFDKPQRQLVFELLQNYCQEVWVSCRKEQIEFWQDDLPYLFDNQVAIGPLAGLLAAFAYAPHSPWLVVACDMPFINREVLDFLVAHRQPQKNATALQNPEGGFPEPLLTIWESSSYTFLENAQQNKHFSLVKILQSLDIQLISYSNAKQLQNINTWAEYQRVGQGLNKE
jgi:molybdenum cofactor guanylyltransferase